MSSDRAPAERPESPAETDSADEIDATSETDHGLGNITTRPGARKTSDIETLKIEAELVADGHEPANPATPVDAETGEKFFEDHIEDTDLVPAWTRPWEDAE